MARRQANDAGSDVRPTFSLRVIEIRDQSVCSLCGTPQHPLMADQYERVFICLDCAQSAFTTAEQSEPDAEI